MRSEGVLPSSGILEFRSGDVSFQKRDVSANVEEVVFNLKLESGEKALGIGQYDKATGAMIRWREKK